MRIATTTKTERTVAALAARVFDVSGPGAATVRAAAEAALLEANPHLRDLGELPEGIAVLVPDVTGAVPVETQGPAAPATQLASEMRRALARLSSSLEAAATREDGAARATLALLESRELKALGRKSPALAERLPAMSAAATARAKEAQALAAFGKSTLSAATKDLGELLGRLT